MGVLGKTTLPERKEGKVETVLIRYSFPWEGATLRTSSSSDRAV